ncbi:hypothetical protein [Streptomyces niveus]|uniref:hypothetical protein n=1 Tax=Streptomyces niveus TaxID=193462 RepID=UPI003428CC53
MDLELLPDTGVASIRLGMSVGEAAVRAGQAIGFLPDAKGQWRLPALHQPGVIRV